MSTRKPKKKAARKRASKKNGATKKSVKRNPAKKTLKARSTKKSPKVTEKRVKGSSSFSQAQSKAEMYAKNPKKLQKLFEDAAEKSKEAPKDTFGETWAYLQAMIRLIRAYAAGTYRDIPVGSLMMILVAVIYFVSPVDLIPDAIPVAGFIDDALVVSLAIKQVKSDLDAFMDWELEADGAAS